MKKNILFAAFCFLAGTANAQFTFFDPNLNIQFADIVAVDIDNDGDLDVVASGETRTSPAPASAIFINNGGTFSKQTAANVIVPGHFADIKFGDLDGDGDLDVIFNGDSNGALGRGIALNNGSGVFTRSSLDVTNATISCGFADLDNDALLDYYAFGNGPDNQGTLFLQNDNGSFFVDRSSFANLNLNSPDVSVLDFNRDGYPDLFILATDNAGVRYSAVWVNDGFGRFSAIPQPNLVRKGQGTATWGDVDGDGWLDLLLNGDGGTDNEASSDIYRLYRNNNGILESKATFSDFRQINVGDGSRMVDWDNDGDLDILLTGWSESRGRQATMLFTCTNAANFAYTESPLGNTDFPGVSEGAIETADLNQDGKIDLLVTGFNGSGTTQVGKYNKDICGYYLNKSANTNQKPSVVGNLNQAFSVSGDEPLVTFTWDAATDDHTPSNSLTYNLALRDATSGKWFLYPNARMGDADDGCRSLSEMGNVYTNRSWKIFNLPPSTYQWTVQAIDANFVGGPFAPMKTFSFPVTNLGNPVESLNVSALDGQLLLENSTGNEATVRVYTASGKLVKELKTMANATLKLNKGFYIVKANAGLITLVGKVVL